MTARIPLRSPSRARFLQALLAATLLSACQTDAERPSARPAAATPAAREAGLPVAGYLQALDDMTAGDLTRQQATLLAARSAWQQAATPANTLRYALVLGTPGHDDSNPLEASRLLAGLLTAPERLSPDEVKLASAFQREFTARVSQYADLARARTDTEARLRAAEAESQSRINALSADLARVRRERDTVQEKLDAIADIEKTLMERDDGAAAAPDGALP
jgi:hypothetical protein